MSEPTLTHKDLAALLGVSETTVKSYRRKFPGCIPVASKGKPIRFTPDASKVALRIRDLFETGMSVEEVRARLAAEFSWISPGDPAPARGGGARQSAEISPELSQGVSNMAKSLVAMTQQQKAILGRIQSLEALLADLGLGEGAEGELAAALGKRAEEAGQRREMLDSRLETLDKLDHKVERLSATVGELAGQLDRFLARRAKAAEEWRQAGPNGANGADSAPAALAERTGEQPDPARKESARIIPLRHNDDAAAALGRAQGAAVPDQDARAAPQEPPRRFFSLPLVARTEQGKYISAGGRSRGPFSLNDLKAMLIYGFTPPNHFTLRWENHGQGWWLFLEQEQGGGSIHLLLMELPTQKGGSVAEILQIVHSGETVHPAEICGIVDSFAS